jgi:DNA polymerase-4
MDVIAAANARQAALPPGAPHVIRMEVGQPGTGAPAGAVAAAQSALRSGAPLGYTEAFGLRSLRARIREELALPASAGVASVKFVAKIASDLAKPDGMRVVEADDTVSFLAALPVARLWGVGPRTEARLVAFGLRTVGDVAARSPEWMEAQLGALGVHLAKLSRGDDARMVVPDRDAKSVGAEDTFSEDLDAPDALHPHLLSQALRVGRRLRRAGRVARAVVLKLKTTEFKLVTRRTTLATPTDDGQCLFAEARAMLARYVSVEGFAPMRLCGVSAQDLEEPARQGALFAPEGLKRAKLNAALDKIHAVYGRSSVVPADLAPDTGRAARRAAGEGESITESLDTRRRR